MKVVCDEFNNTEDDLQNRVLHIDIVAETVKDIITLNDNKSTNQKICECEIPKPRDMKEYYDKDPIICENCNGYISIRKLINKNGLNRL